MAEFQEAYRILVAHVLDYVAAKNSSEPSFISAQVRAGVLALNRKSSFAAYCQSFFGVVNPDGLDTSGREEVEEYSPATADIQDRSRTAEIFDKWLLDASNGIFAATKFI